MATNAPKNQFFTFSMGYGSLTTDCKILCAIEITVSIIIFTLTAPSYKRHHEDSIQELFIAHYYQWVMIDRSLVVLTSIYLYISIYQQDQLLVTPYIVWAIVQIPINLLCCMYLTKVIEMWVVLPWSITFMEFYGGILAASIRSDWKSDEIHRQNTLKIYNALQNTYSTKKPSMKNNGESHENYEQHSHTEFQLLNVKVEAEDKELSEDMRNVQRERELLKQKWDEIRREEIIRQMIDNERRKWEKKEAKKTQKSPESERLKLEKISTTPIQNEKSRINEHEQMSRLKTKLNKATKKFGGLKKSKNKRTEKDMKEVEEKIKAPGSTKLIHDIYTEESNLSTIEVLPQVHTEKNIEMTELTGIKNEENLTKYVEKKREPTQRQSSNANSKSEYTKVNIHSETKYADVPFDDTKFIEILNKNDDISLKKNVECKEVNLIQGAHSTIEKINDAILEDMEGNKHRENWELEEWSDEKVTEVQYEIDSSNDKYEFKNTMVSKKIISKDIYGEEVQEISKFKKHEYSGGRKARVKKNSSPKSEHKTEEVKMKKNKIGSKKLN